MGGGEGKLRPGRLLFPAGYYAANSVYQGYVSLWYTHLGFHSGQLGLISAATAAAALAAQPLWGMLGDRSGDRRKLLGALCLASAASLLPMLAGRGLWQQAGAAALFYAFFSALLPLGDAILLDGEGNFGACRLAGGLSFALAGFIFGAVRGRLAPGGVVWAAMGLLVACFFASRLLPPSPGRGAKRRLCAFALLRDGELRRMLLFLMPLQMSMGYFYTFHAPYFKSLGGTDFQLGLGCLLSSAGEAPYLLLSGRIYRRFGALRPMCFGAAAMALRWVLLGGAASPGAALLTQLLHGAGFIVVTVSLAYWINDHVPLEARTSGQALLNMAGFGVARVAGNLLGGQLARVVGEGKAFYAGAALCVAALAAFLPRAFRRG